MCSNLACFAIAVAISTGCAPRIDPLDRQRAIDRRDGEALAAAIARLPGVVTADVALRHARRDPLAPAAAPPTPAALAAVIAIDDRAAPAAIRDAATRLARAALPALAGAAPAIEIHAAPPALVAVGPFVVERASRGPLRGLLALAAASIALLAAALAVLVRRHRRGISAQ